MRRRSPRQVRGIGRDAVGEVDHRVAPAGQRAALRARRGAGAAAARATRSLRLRAAGGGRPSVPVTATTSPALAPSRPTRASRSSAQPTTVTAIVSTGARDVAAGDRGAGPLRELAHALDQRAAASAVRLERRTPGRPRRRRRPSRPGPTARAASARWPTSSSVEPGRAGSGRPRPSCRRSHRERSRPHDGGVVADPAQHPLGGRRRAPRRSASTNSPTTSCGRRCRARDQVDGSSTPRDRGQDAPPEASHLAVPDLVVV